MKNAVKHLWDLSKDEKERRRLDAIELYRKDVKAEMDYMKKQGREEGKKQGREEGKKQGREEGKKEGREEGKKQGREEGERMIALKMLKDGIPLEQIAKYTKFTIVEIKELKKKERI